MKGSADRAGRQLLFRGYLALVGSLLVIAWVLDLGLQWSAPEDRVTIALASATLNATEQALLGADEDFRSDVLDQFSSANGFTVSLLSPEDVAGPVQPGLQEIHDREGRVFFLRYSTSLDAYLQLGPLDQDSRGLSRWLSPLFYLAVIVVIGLWLWPLVRDLTLISHSAQAFASDYRNPLKTADKTTVLTGLATSLDDMSAQIHALIENQKELTSALSHEMRTPLARIRFALAMIRDRLDVDELAQIENDVAEIDRLIATLLDFARLDHPGTELQWQHVPIAAWLDEALQRASGNRHNIRVHNAIAGGTARIDPGLMELAVSNLVVNAERYAKSHVDVSVATESGALVIHVDDDGPGIPEGQREAVFNAFTRLDDSRSKTTGGYGLGLAIVRRIAVLHGGNVCVSTAPTGGARMTIQIPR